MNIICFACAFYLVCGMNETFERLDVWRRSHALSIEVYRLLTNCRDWGFKDQITRSTNSIADNVAEGSERPGKAEYRQFVGYAKGSAGESRSQMLRARALGYIQPDTADRLIAELQEISRMLHGLYHSLGQSRP
jgi:four helix bundle protein